MVNSRRKGKRGEIEASHAIEQCLGISARRGVQYRGTPDSPDVVTEIDGVHIEVKRTEKFSLYEAVEQAIRDGRDDVPLVLYRRSRKPWLVVVPLDRLADLVRSLKEVVS